MFAPIISKYVVFLLLQQRLWIQTFILLSTMSLLVWHFRWVQWSRNDVGSPKPTSFISTFHIGSMFCFFPASLISSSYTRTRRVLILCSRVSIPNLELSPIVFHRTFSNCLSHHSPAKGWPYRFRSREKTGSSFLDHDFGHSVSSVDVSKHPDTSDFGIFNNDGAIIFHFYLGISRYCVCCLSCASWQSWIWHPLLLLPSVVLLMNSAL